MHNITKLQADLNTVLKNVADERGEFVVCLIRNTLFVYTTDQDIQTDANRADGWHEPHVWNLAHMIIHPYPYNGLGFHKCRYDFREIRPALEALGWRCSNTVGEFLT